MRTADKLNKSACAKEDRTWLPRRMTYVSGKKEKERFARSLKGHEHGFEDIVGGCCFVGYFNYSIRCV